jgi:3-methyladenine DNA glycosylase AlkC
MTTRKGTNRQSDIPAAVLYQLNAGTMETATLAEGLAIDFAVLMSHVLPEAKDEATQRFNSSDGITKRMSLAGQVLLEKLGASGYQRVTEHPSDTVRGWAAFMLAEMPNLSLKERIERVHPLADDKHLGVREWAWLALRPHIAKQIQEAIQELSHWIDKPSASLRRFAVESTRPRGVWCAHIAELKRKPEIALPLLEPVKSDGSRYVQDSVSNWLNDAAKSQPDWVTATCEKWRKESDTKETARICVRALRSIKT